MPELAPPPPPQAEFIHPTASHPRDLSLRLKSEARLIEMQGGANRETVSAEYF
jgi:hypothetical protein